MEQIARALRAALPDGAVRDDDAARHSYAYDNSRRRALPAVVVCPASTAEVVTIVETCAAQRVPLTARGMGSATTGAAVPVAGGVVVSFERMTGILETRAADRLMVVQPGALNAEVQQAAANVGCFWAPDPTSAAYSTVGGNLACNAAGPRAVKYGTARENTLALEVVTGAGQRLRTGTRTTKGAVGYDLTRLIIGSEGTLGLITEATLLLTPLQPARATLRAAYLDAAAAADAVAAIMAGSVTPCALEFMDATAVAIVRDADGVNLPEGTGALLLIEVDGCIEHINADLDAITASATNSGAIELRKATDDAEVAALWRCRRALSPAQRTLRPDKINEDVVVPVSRLPELVQGIRTLAEQHDVLVLSFGHAGNGNLHVNLLGDDSDRARRESCLRDLFELVLRLDGSLSGEHGIGLEKRSFIGMELDRPSLRLMQDIKSIFDPQGIMNPGKVFP